MNDACRTPIRMFAATDVIDRKTGMTVQNATVTNRRAPETEYKI